MCVCPTRRPRAPPPPPSPRSLLSSCCSPRRSRPAPPPPPPFLAAPSQHHRAASRLPQEQASGGGGTPPAQRQEESQARGLCVVVNRSFQLLLRSLTGRRGPCRESVIDPVDHLLLIPMARRPARQRRPAHRPPHPHARGEHAAGSLSTTYMLGNLLYRFAQDPSFAETLPPTALSSRRRSRNRCGSSRRCSSCSARSRKTPRSATRRCTRASG